MEYRAPLITTGNTLQAKPVQKNQIQDKGLDFLKELLAKLPYHSKPGSGEIQEESGEGNRPETELLECSAEELISEPDQTKPNDSRELSQNFLPEITDQTNPIQGKVEGDQKDTPTLLLPFPPLEPPVVEEGNPPLEGIETPAKDLSGTGKALLHLREREVDKKTHTAPVSGSLMGQGEDLFEESLATGSGKIGDQWVIKGDVDEKSGWSSPAENNHAVPERPLFQALTTLRGLDGTEGEKSEAGEGKKSLSSLFGGETYFDSSKGGEGNLFQSGSESSSGFERFKEASFQLKGQIRQENETVQDSIPPLDLPNHLSWDPTGAVKNSVDFRNPLHHPRPSAETDLLKAPSFTVLKQGPTSMEISLEPAGLGKLDLELNLNQDRLQGHILVHNNAGKELIEQNLPQLLSDLAREGLQIGGFTVSLKNQGKDQNPILIRNELEEIPLSPVGPEKIGPLQGNHLIHIII